jgi:putative FmdB family regulatory protein
MPLYEFTCQKCHIEYDDLCAFDASGKYPDVKCPKCGSVKKTKLLSVANFTFAQPEGTDRYNNHHDYRWKHKQPQVRKERAMAEAASKMGHTPYNPIDDVSGGEFFGEVE